MFTLQLRGSYPRELVGAINANRLSVHRRHDIGDSAIDDIADARRLRFAAKSGDSSGSRKTPSGEGVLLLGLPNGLREIARARQVAFQRTKFNV
jgi:hypothetical protein